MRVFLSWSGQKSHELAKIFYEWLPNVIQSLDPFISSSDIDKGARWASDISKNLQDINFGLVFVTKENISAPWVLFEAGALSKSLHDGRVAPIIFDIVTADLSGSPLLQFQVSLFKEDEILKLLNSMNAALGDKAVREDVLQKTFQKFWPDLQAKVEKIVAKAVPGEPSSAAADRPLDELLVLSREQLKTIKALEERLIDDPVGRSSSSNQLEVYKDATRQPASSNQRLAAIFELPLRTLRTSWPTACSAARLRRRSSRRPVARG
jgi:hypothetical protein